MHQCSKRDYQFEYKQNRLQRKVLAGHVASVQNYQKQDLWGVRSFQDEHIVLWNA